ncbi:MAG: hypothetical protein ACIAXF_03080, partial [Phycisphaerales bacterium JB063]
MLEFLHALFVFLGTYVTSHWALITLFFVLLVGILPVGFIWGCFAPTHGKRFTLWIGSLCTVTAMSTRLWYWHASLKVYHPVVYNATPFYMDVGIKYEDGPHDESDVFLGWKQMGPGTSETFTVHSRAWDRPNFRATAICSDHDFVDWLHRNDPERFEFTEFEIASYGAPVSSQPLAE